VTCLVGRAANRAGDDAATVVTGVIACSDIVFDGGDIVVPVQKTDSKSEGGQGDLSTVRPSS
jgi:hypothetical protein